jgi:pimeloyl-ACP methyl ester carboxylesterase
MVVEKALRFGSGNHLVGVLSLATDVGNKRVGAILLNAGLVYRVGPNRLHVRMGRALAAAGISTLRMDQSGVGDSTSAQMQTSGSVVADVKAAVDLLEQQTGVDKIFVFGICAGAVNSYKASLEDARIRGVVLLDGYLYRTWKTYPHYILERLRRGINWRQLLDSSSREFMRRFRGSIAIGPAITFMTGSTPKSEYAAGLRLLSERGAVVSQIVSGDFLTHYSYADQFTDGFASYNLGSKVSADFFPEADHMFTAVRLQNQLIELVVSKALQVD